MRERERKKKMVDRLGRWVGKRKTKRWMEYNLYKEIYMTDERCGF